MLPHPPGAVCILANELARYTSFWTSVAQLRTPPGGMTFTMAGVEFTHNLNKMCQATLAESHLAWLWVLGDDHVFSPDTLERLLDHEVDVVVPHCLHRGTRPAAVAFDEQPGGDFTLRPLDGAGGLRVVDAAGSAGMLIRRRVLERMASPWFRIGLIKPDCNGEDLSFCRAARAAGFDIHYDLETPLGHTTAVTLWPHRTDDGRWTTRYAFPSGNEIVAASPAPVGR